MPIITPIPLIKQYLSYQLHIFFIISSLHLKSKMLRGIDSFFKLLGKRNLESTMSSFDRFVDPSGFRPKAMGEEKYYPIK